MKKKTKKTKNKALMPSASPDLFFGDDNDAIDVFDQMQMESIAGEMFNTVSEATTKFQQTAVALMQLIVAKDDSFNSESTILSLYDRVMDHVIKTSPLKEVMDGMPDDV